jgi:hypothetical protein
MSTQPTQPPDSPEDQEPDTIATPEGDNEAPPDQPLSPLSAAVERPRGDDPHIVQPLYRAED